MSKPANIILSFFLLMSSAPIAFGQDWPEQRCDEIENRLVLLEGQNPEQAEAQNVRSAPQIRAEIAEREKELALLQTFQRGGQFIQLSTVVNHVPLIATAMVGSLSGMTPILAEKLVHRAGDLQAYINQQEIRLRQTELPRLREEQTEVGRQIFILRDSAESLKCNQRGLPLQIIIGKWRAAESGNVIEFVPGGNGFLRELGGASAAYGFKPGDAVFSEIREVEGDLAARMIIRASMQDCPTLEPITTTATIKIAPDNRTFLLSAPGYNYCANLCKWTVREGETFDRTYSRAD